MHAVLTHIAVHVADVDACVAFYQEYAGLIIVKERIPTNTTLTAQTSQRIVWLAEQDKSQDFIIVVLPNGVLKPQAEQDFSHLGFAMASKLAVDQIAAQAQQQGILVWPCKQEQYPVGYYCGVRDPNGNLVEFSYGQPLGPGAQ